MQIKVKKLDQDAVLPSYAHPGDAGMDLFALENTRVAPGEIVAVKTGIALQIPKGFVGLIWDKSGIAIKNGLKVMGGVIDSGYRGEIMVGIINFNKTDYIFEKGHKIAQMLVQKVESPKISEVKDLSASWRGKRGFGSTGK